MSETTTHVIDHADGRIEGVEVTSDGSRLTLYRGHKIYFDAPPIPIRTMDWHYYHEDYDGPEDNRHGDGPSLADCKAQIDDWWLEQEN